ncbi:sensor histidine kinase [Streptomyces sp. UNOC14_S4]|uniref:sensor histidine kinase n=1 Tax=Streptomyces sp. UNOC14_S4 TaxID=2872340 RepID=UPI001E43047F|nr:sensor histidine kinase [Streptomyces sp. UNOC14_S4]MCC3766677.1 sensor histidine kinase [Streptomyces sp. UNOC14_S4]
MCDGTTRPTTARQPLALGSLSGLCIAVSLVSVVAYGVNFLAHDRMPPRSISTLSVALATGVLALLTCGLRRARRLLAMICCGFTVLSVDRFAHSTATDHAAMAFLLAASVYAVPAWPEMKVVLSRGRASAMVERQEHHAGLLAGELHDEVLQLLALTRRRLDAARALDDPRALRAAMDDASRTLDEQAGTLRRIIATVSPATVQGRGLAESVTSLAGQIAAENGLVVDMDVQGDRPHACAGDNGVNLAVYRVAQEALTNVVKHADAQHVTVTLVCRDDGIGLTVTDDGRGLGPNPPRAPEGYGMQGMRWRCEAYGGTFAARTAGTGGTVVRAVFPLRSCRKSRSRGGRGTPPPPRFPG